MAKRPIAAKQTIPTGAKNVSQKAPISVKKVTGSSSSFWKNKALWLPILVVLVITAVVFIPSLSNAFVNWDDDDNLIKNPFLKAFDWASIKGIFTNHVIGNYNPLPIFSFAIEKKLFGMYESGLKPTVFHFNNLLLHLICVFFAYRILLELKLSAWAAALGALLFGIHPMRVESVAWVTEIGRAHV